MKLYILILSLVVLGLGSCQKKIDIIVNTITNKGTSIKTSDFVKYTILKGEQYSDKSSFSSVNFQQLSFNVRFDSSAIYHTISPANQGDINKLLGFSDNNATHHEYSARFGWRWSENALHIFAYTYNNSIMSYKELGIVEIGAEHYCSIKIANDTYIFSVNGKETTMPRLSKTATAQGYKLYPYFGGDEIAPHTISIWIKEL